MRIRNWPAPRLDDPTYTKSRQKLGGKGQGGARRDLEDLRAAINQTRADIHDGPEQNSRPAHELGELRGNALDWLWNAGSLTQTGEHFAGSRAKLTARSAEGLGDSHDQTTY
jgi:hypothetical protein